MADKKTDIEIGLKATGGDAAAGEIGKPIEVMEAAAEAAAELADYIREMGNEMREAGASADDVAAAQAPLIEQLNAITDAIHERNTAEAETLAMAKAMADARQAEGDAQAIAKAQAEAFEAEAKAIRELEEAYAAAAIEAAELAQAAADAAEAEFAESTKTQDEALKRLGASVRNLIPGYSAMSAKIQGVQSAWSAASAAGTTFGSKLLTLAGGPIGVATAAFAVITGVVVKYWKEVQAAREKNTALADQLLAIRTRLDELAQPTNDVAEATKKHAEAIQSILDKSSDLEADATTRKDRLTDLIELEKGYRDAIVDRDLAAGKITPQEAARLKGENEITAMDAAAQAAVDAANERLQITGDALGNLTRELLAARQALGQAETGGDSSLSDRAAEAAKRGARAQSQADFIDQSGATVDPNYLEKILGGPEAVKKLVMDNLGIEGGAGVAIMFRKQLIDALNERAATEKRVADRLSKEAEEESAERKKVIKAKRDELEAIESAIADQKKERDAAAAAVRDAETQRQNNEQFRKPTVALGVDAEVAKIEAEQKKKADEAARKEAERIAKEAEKEAARSAQEEIEKQRAALGVDQRAVAPGLAARADRIDAAGLTEAAKVMDSAAKGFANGAGLGEIENVMFEVATVLRDTPESNQRIVEAALAPLKSALSDYKRRIETIESQIKANR